MKLLEYVICLLLVLVKVSLNQDPNVNDLISKPRFAISLDPPEDNDDHIQSAQCEDLNRCSDKNGYDAIKKLHEQLDDDANGNIDLEESDEFLRDELQYENGYERHQGFHGNDKYINVDELWETWKASEVHNWTVEETVEWLVSYVELPQYVSTFQNHNVDGTKLPRLAVNSINFMSVILGIKDPIHKQKIALKAMDVVLFGPPKYHNYLKDVLLVMCLVIAIGGCWFAYVQHKYSQTHLLKMVKDMESLQNAEESLLELQKKLDEARLEQEIVAIEKENLEKRLQDEIITAKQQAYEKQELNNAKQGRVMQLEDELRDAQEDLRRMKKMLESKAWAPPTELQNWLQLTHELELRYYNAKKASAEKQLAAAKEGCEKLRRKRTAFMGAFRIAHGSSIDDVDNRILQAKAALCEITKDLQERLYRWRQIEMLCGFPIVHNPGLLYLETVLKTHTLNGSVGIPSYNTRRGTLARSSSEGTLLRDSPPPYAAELSAIQELIQNTAALFLVPVPPACRDPLLTSQSSNLSLLPTSLLPSTTTTAKLTLVNDSLSHYPPPPSYSTEHQDCNSRDHTPEQKISLSLQSHPEVPSEEDAEEEEDDTDRSVTPLSSISTSGVSDKPEFTVGDSPSDTNSPTDSNINQSRLVKSIILEYQTSVPQTGTLMQSMSCQSLPNHGDSLPIIPSEVRKKSNPLSITLRQTLSGSNMSKDNSTQSNSSLEEEGKKDKKKRQLFPQLRKRKV